MKTKYSIGFLIINIMILISLLLPFETNKSLYTEETPMNTVTTDGSITNEECYYLFEANGYIVVYLSDQKTPFEYTDIRVEELPALVRTEIKNGKFIRNLEELYGFLENYSS